MRELRKVFVLLSAAIGMEGVLAAEALAAEGAADRPKNGKADKAKEKAKAKEKERVGKVRKARRRPADRDEDFGMPAGTLYDVIAKEDLR